MKHFLKLLLATVISTSLLPAQSHEPKPESAKPAVSEPVPASPAKPATPADNCPL